MDRALITASQPARPAEKAAIRRHFCIVTETYHPEINGVALTMKRLTEGLRAQGSRVSLVRPRQRGFDDRHEILLKNPIAFFGLNERRIIVAKICFGL